MAGHDAHRLGADVLLHEYVDWIAAGMVAPEFVEAATAKALGHTRAVRRVAGMHGASRPSNAHRIR